MSNQFNLEEEVMRLFPIDTMEVQRWLVCDEPNSITDTSLVEVDMNEEARKKATELAVSYTASLRTQLNEATKRIQELEAGLEELYECVPKQTVNQDWWEDSMTNAMNKAKSLLKPGK